MKYLLKNTTKNTVWRKVLTTQTNIHSSVRDAGTNDTSPVPDGKCTNLDQMSTSQDQTLTSKSNADAAVKVNGVKLCTWSRNFDFSPFYVPPPLSPPEGQKSILMES